MELEVHSWSGFQSYLCNRSQGVQVNSYLSEFEIVRHGVPQGSILRPLLFLIYINDIIISSSKVEFLLFADDTSLFLANKSLKTIELVLNSELKNILNWLKANKLSLNVKKSNVLIFRQKNAKRVEDIVNWWNSNWWKWFN